MRKAVFWIHLACGVVTGLVIAMMAVTGVALTYERQILAWADGRSHAPIDIRTAPRQSVEALREGLRIHDPDFAPTSVTFSSDPASAVTFGAGRGSGSRLVDPYTGAVLGEGAQRLRAFFGAVTGWHRWFNASGDARGPWRAVTGISNLAFLFLLLSGLYLWLPRVWKSAAFRVNLWFNPKVNSAKARDYNWHHVFGFWTALPLVVIVYTATVFYYGWSNDLLYAAFGESPPQRGGSPPAAHPVAPSAHSRPLHASLDALLSTAMLQVSDWNRITMELPAATDSEVRFTLDRGTGGQPQHRHTLVLDAATGAIASWEPFGTQSPGRQARSWARFLHTGEAFGLAGQTIAGLVSATTLIMVWTGFALAWRRLVTPLLRRGNAR